MLERIFQEPKFRVCCLGAIKLVEVGSGTDMTPAGRKTRALLGYLCIVGKPVGREKLAALLWGDRGDEQARASLRQAIYELRSLLGGDHLVRVERDTVAAGDQVGTDVGEILATAQSGDLEQLGQALSGWRGEFFEDLPSIDPSFDAWLQAERHRIQENLIAAATEAAKCGMARGEIGEARKIVNLLQQHDGTNEVVLRLGLRLDHLAGDSGALHRRYERFRELLKSELDAAPAVETQALFEDLARKPAAPIVRAQPNLVGDETISVAPPTIRARGWFKPAVFAIVVVSLCTIAGLIWSRHETAPPRPEPLLAVMPFQNLGADSSSRDFSSRISSEIADALVQTTKIRVARAPSGFPGTAAPAATHVLSGSVERTGNRVHLVAQLMDLADDRVVWGHAYDGALSQTQALRHDIAAQIARALAALLLSDSFGAVPMGSAAYDHYLRGRNLLRQDDPGAAASELEESVRLAPNSTNAWATLVAARLRACY